MAEDIAQQPLSGKEIRRLKEERREVWRKKKSHQKTQQEGEGKGKKGLKRSRSSLEKDV